MPLQSLSPQFLDNKTFILKFLNNAIRQPVELKISEAWPEFWFSFPLCILIASSGGSVFMVYAAFFFLNGSGTYNLSRQPIFL
jgi:hypothetical protein